MIKFWRLPPRSAERIAAKAAWEAHYGPISYDALPDYFRFDKRFNPKLVSRHGTGYAVGMTGHHHHYSTQLGQRVATLLARTTLAPLTDWTVTAPMTLQSPSGIDCDLDTVFEIAVERLRSVFVV